MFSPSLVSFMAQTPFNSKLVAPKVIGIRVTAMIETRKVRNDSPLLPLVLNSIALILTIPSNGDSTLKLLRRAEIFR